MNFGALEQRLSLTAELILFFLPLRLGSAVVSVTNSWKPPGPPSLPQRSPEINT